MLSSCCQYFLCFLPSNCHNLWPIMQAVLLTFKYFQRVDKNKLQQQGLFTQIFNGLILDFAFRASNGAVRIAAWGSSGLAWARALRAVCVDVTFAGGTWMWAGTRPAPAAGAAVCASWPEPRRPARTLPVFWRWRAPRRWCAPAPGAGRRQHLSGLQTPSSPWTFCGSTVPTDWAIPALSWPHSSPTRHFWSITSLLPVFPHYYHHYYLLKPSLLHSLYPGISTLLPIITVKLFLCYICYYIIITYYYQVIIRAEVRRSFITVWDESQVTPQGRHHYYLLLR